MAESDYGSTLTKGGITIGKAMVLDWPELATAKINTTNHASGGWSEGIPSGLIEAGDITIMLLMESGTYAAIVAEMLAKTISPIVLADEVDQLNGDGFYLSIKKEAQDAQSPNAVRASVVISFTGELDIT